jgi:hypothetical protein
MQFIEFIEAFSRVADRVITKLDPEIGIEQGEAITLDKKIA